MKENPIFVAAMLSLAVRSCRAAPALSDAMAAYARHDYIGAERALHAAATDDSAEAQQLLGFMHAIGGDFYPGVRRDTRAASLWLERAARKGAPAARYMHEALARRGPAEIYADVTFCFARMEGRDEPLRRLMAAAPLEEDSR